MKKLLFISLLVTLFFNQSLWAANSPTQLSCHSVAKSSNVQCIYKVTGEVINQPKKMTKLYANTAMPYALCSKAICTIDKSNPNMATCSCEVFSPNDRSNKWRVASVGPLPYEKAKPVIKNAQLNTVISTFSMANVKDKSKPGQTICNHNKKSPWANCYGATCAVTETTVNNKKQLTASCQCPIVKTQQFVSMGPNGDTSKCQLPDQKIWSAATKTQGNNNLSIMKDMYKAYFK